MVSVGAAITTALALFPLVSPSIKNESGRRKKVKDGVQDMELQLKKLQAYLDDSQRIEGGEVFKNRVMQIRDIAYDIEDALAMFMSKVQYHSYHNHTISRKAHQFFHYCDDRSALTEMFSKIEDIKRKIENFFMLERLDIGRTDFEHENVPQNYMETTSHITEGYKLFGFEKPKKKIMNQLIHENDPRRNTLVVFGPPGSGKTILVKTVYNDKRVWNVFDCHAWVSVARSFQIGEILLSMLKQLCPETFCEGLVRADDTLVKLRDCVREKRYVVVLDDIRREQDFKTITSALPDGLPGSKIIITTRSRQDVVFNLSVNSTNNIHELNGLSWQHAWELFCDVTFNTRKCPGDLKQISQKILERCEGLPLPIVEVGTLLSKKPRFPYDWNKFHDSFASEIASTNSSTSYFATKLLPSYTDLSSNLKACLLYLSIFPEDYCLKRGRLIRTWVAEGFVKETRGKTMEDVADEYLNKLIESNLVVATASDLNGKPISCRVSNLVHQFIIMKSDEDNFVSVSSDPNKSLDKKGRRLSIRDGCHIDLLDPGWSSVRTLFMFGKVSFAQKNMEIFKLLRVLHMQDPTLGDFPEEICDCTLLRYLSLQKTNIDSVPKSIGKLIYLETLDVKDTQVTALPKEILKLNKLRHLLVCSYNVKKNNVAYKRARGVEIFEGIKNLSAIQKLPLIKANKLQDIIVEIGKLVLLRKLGLVDLKTEDGKKLCLSIQNMNDLSTLDIRSNMKDELIDLEFDDLRSSPPVSLQRLYMEGRLKVLPTWIRSLHSLVRIGLRWSRLKDSPLDALQRLPHLRELNLIDAYVGEHMTFRAKKFKSLKILHVECLSSLNMIVVEEGALSELRSLTLRDCKNLKILPLGIDHVYKLEELLLYSMPKVLIEKLQMNGDDRQMIRHIPVIHSYILVDNQWGIPKNLS